MLGRVGGWISKGFYQIFMLDRCLQSVSEKLEQKTR